MRIRKHAKLAGLSLTTTSSDLTPQSSSRFHSPHFCQLNQSPWELLSFPPDSPSSPFQGLVDEEVSNYTNNGSSANSLGAVESVASMKISPNFEDKNVCKYNHGIEAGFGNGGTILCCKKNGKSWKCKKEAWKGLSLCEHHLVHQLTDNYDTITMPAKPPIRRRGRPRKERAVPATPPKAAVTAKNPYEFYYYSGFGPRWGKKRGHFSGPGDGVEEEEIVGGIVLPHSSLLAPSFDSENNDEFDYVEEEEEEINHGNVKKMVRRGRKPIKARSLKSLM